MHYSCSHKLCYVPSALLSTTISLWTHPLPSAPTFNWKSFSLWPSLAKNTNPDWTVDVRMIVLSLRKFCIWVRWYGCWADIEIPSFTFPTGCFEPSSLQADICNCVTVHLQKTQKVDAGNPPKLVGACQQAINPKYLWCEGKSFYRIIVQCDHRQWNMRQKGL